MSTATTDIQPANKSRLAFPHTLVLLFGMIVAAQLLSYVLPSGEFERDERKVLAGTYQLVDAEPLPFYAALSKIPKGMEEAADVIFFVFIIGGVLGILRATGAIDALIGATIKHAEGSRFLVVGGVLALFTLGSATIGMAEEYLPFMPILVTMCLAMGMDAIVALGIIVLGYGIGYGCAPLNPFTVQIAQNIADLAPTSGQLFRWILLVIMFAVGFHHLMSYARRIQADPSKSLVHDIDYSTGFELPEDQAFTRSRMLILVLFVATIGVFAYGSSTWQWYLVELAALFLAAGLIAAAIARMSPNGTASAFCAGAGDMTTAALLIGFARTIEVILVDATVIDTIVHWIAGLLQGLGPVVAAVGMLAVQTVCNLLIPSGSGQAFVTMPIMAPLADLTGLTRQVAVLAYQFGDGFTNMIVPTNAVLMGMLAFARIPYQRWIRFLAPLMIKLYIVAIAALTVAIMTGYK